MLMQPNPDHSCLKWTPYTEPAILGLSVAGLVAKLELLHRHKFTQFK